MKKHRKISETYGSTAKRDQKKQKHLKINGCKMQSSFLMGQKVCLLSEANLLDSFQGFCSNPIDDFPVILPEAWDMGFRFPPSNSLGTTEHVRIVGNPWVTNQWWHPPGHGVLGDPISEIHPQH